MPRRVSMKGKGVDLFFSGDLNPVPATDEPAIALEPAPVEHQPLVSVAPAEDTPSVSDEAQTPEAVQTRAAAPARETTRRRPARLSRAADQGAPQPSTDEAPNTGADVIELIRKTVKTPGREVSFVRLTPEEKGRLADVVYTYKRQGVKTSENEINRIAVHYMLHDYYEHGEASVLARVIAALRA